MFSPEIYVSRRKKLKSLIHSGIGLFIGNVDSPMNYPANPYHFRQDSDFLYFFGLDLPGFTGMIDFDSGEEWIFGDDYGLGDIIWMGPQPSVSELALKSGINKTAPVAKAAEMVSEALRLKRQVHFLPPYRAETKMTLGTLLRENPCQMKTLASTDLIKAVVSLRSIKQQEEIEEIEKAVNIAYEMHTTAMKMCKPGVKEQEIFGIIEGIAWSKGAGPSFPVILSIDGQTLHNHSHHNILRTGRMMVTDAGAESALHYASDITRTTPVGGRFEDRQRSVYEIVLRANETAIEVAAPGKMNRDIHMLACKVIAEGMKDLGIMKGNMDEAVKAGAHALFMPHGLGHMLGLDVHDMEGLGENFVGYNEKVKRSEQFGTAFLRFALECRPGHVFTIEPGCYFIPQLIDQWKAEKKFAEYINYDEADKFRDFGGVRIEDNIVITENGHRLLGRPIPKKVAEIEALCS